MKLNKLGKKISFIFISTYVKYISNSSKKRLTNEVNAKNIVNYLLIQLFLCFERLRQIFGSVTD